VTCHFFFCLKSISQLNLKRLSQISRSGPFMNSESWPWGIFCCAIELSVDKNVDSILWHVWGPSYAHFEHIRNIEGYVTE
jgi:hypothetical protein